MKTPKRSDIEYYASNIVEDEQVGRCETCKKYGHLMDCGNCQEGSEYSFDYQTYYNENKTNIDKWIERKANKELIEDLALELQGAIS